MSVLGCPIEDAESVPPQPSLAGSFRWRRFCLAIGIGLLFCGLVVIEVACLLSHRHSVARIKSWAKTLPSQKLISLQDLQAQLSGWPARRLFEHEGSLRMIFTWPSVVGTYRMRALIRKDGTVVYIDTEQSQVEDFMTPFLVANEDGIRVVVPGEPPPSYGDANSTVDLWQEVRLQFGKPRTAEVPRDPNVFQNPEIVRHLNRNLQSRSDLINLIRMAPDCRGDAAYHHALVVGAHALKEDELAAELLRIWRIEDNGYASRVARAQCLAELAWADLGNYISTPPTPAMRQSATEKFEHAKTELEQALLLQPDGADAHAEMIQVAQGLGQPWPVIRTHFETAIRFSPDNQLAWRYVLLRTQDRQGAKNAAAAYEFAEMCLTHGKWEQVPALLRGAAYDHETRSINFQQFQSPEHWRLIQAFYQAAQHEKLDPDRWIGIQACFAHDAAVSGHNAEAAPIFDQLDLLRPSASSSAAPQPPNLTPTTWGQIMLRFGGEGRYLELRNKVRAAIRRADSSR